MKCNNHSSRPMPMSLQDWASEVEQVMDRVFGRQVPGGAGTTSPGSSTPTGSFVPAMDVSESETEFLVHLDLPGVKLEDVTVEIHDDRLTIHGKRHGVCQSEGAQVHRVERMVGEFTRRVALPKTVDQDKVQARFEHGVLHIHLPKVVKNQPRKIEVHG